MTLLCLLIFIAVALTSTMFATRQMMLGFPSAMFWAIAGAQAYTLSTVPWGDIYYYLAFGSLLGMVIFTAFAAYSLREKRDTIADEEMEHGEGNFIDEEEPKPSTRPTLSGRASELRKRANKRRRYRASSTGWPEEEEI